MTRLEYLNDRLRESSSECMLWPYSTNGRGYGAVYESGKVKRVHRVSLERKRGPAPVDMPYALHSCLNKMCFNPEHLSWGSQQENMNHKKRDGTSAKGEAVASSKLDAEKVKSILADTRSNVAIARDYFVHHSTISLIKTGKRWGHVQ